MPVTVEWDNAEKTIVHMHLTGNWTWGEAYAASDEGYALLESVPYEVGVIMDMTQSNRIPDKAIVNAQAMIKRRHPRTGLTVFVGVNSFVTAMWNIFSQLYAVLARKQNSVFSKSVEEARAILAKQYPVPTTSAVPSGESAK